MEQPWMIWMNESHEEYDCKKKENSTNKTKLCKYFIGYIVDTSDDEWVPNRDMTGAIRWYFGMLWPLLLTWFNFNPSMDK